MHLKQLADFRGLREDPWFSAAWMNSGHLLPLKANGAETDFIHIFCTLLNVDVEWRDGCLNSLLLAIGTDPRPDRTATRIGA